MDSATTLDASSSTEHTPALSVTAAERAFDITDVFFSTTDRRGVIRSGNDVFARVSGYRISELVGRPHNVIRHPDTPRTVFRLLWSHLEAGQPIAAYVKNRAHDGSYYWVMAAARPVGDTMLSVRLKPTSPIVDEVKALYAEMAIIERHIEDSGGSRRDAMDSSTALMLERIGRLGFADYGGFMRTALAAEVTARRELLRAERRSARPAASALGEQLDGQLTALDAYTALNEQLLQRSVALVDIAEDGKLLALNAVLASRRLGADGGPLVAIAESMQHTFPRVIDQSRVVVAKIEATHDALKRVGFAVGLAVLQDEIVTHVLAEIASGHHVGDSDLGLLAACLDADVDNLATTLRRVERGLRDAKLLTTQLENDLIALAAIERNGRVEASRATNAHSFDALLVHIRERVTTALTETRQLRNVTEQAGLDAALLRSLAARHR